MNNFEVWFEEFISKHNFDPKLKNKVNFLPFNQYSNFRKSKNQFTVFEDQWIQSPEIIISKIKSIYGFSERIFARKCRVKKIYKYKAKHFLNKHHIYGNAKSKHRYGLFFDKQLIAVSTFAGQRNFPKGRSAEMLRFCNASGLIVIGGFSKLLKAYIRDYKPDDIMTYADPDWGTGNSYKKRGFAEAEKRDAINFFCHKKTGKRIPEKHFTDYKNISQYQKLTNSGSLKFVLNLNK
ncbi:MAG: hypothetical protein U9N85_10090 [Bacteroidota bacterium]|nr:hypothetical protein [Bacteroidota bacterium]